MSPRGATPSRVTPQTVLAELLVEHPEARIVLERHGLARCGGNSGPFESIRLFARTHGVEEDRLVAEIEEAVAAPDAGLLESSLIAADAADSTVGDTIYRRFFLGALVIVLTIGGGTGVWLLWRIVFAGTFQDASLLFAVNGHGHAQIFGWVGLFIMGFAYQAFPRLWHTNLVRPRLAVGVFWTMVAGVLLRSVALDLHSTAFAIPGTVVGGLLEIGAIAAFTAQIVATLLKSRMRTEPWIGFVLAALGCFAAMGLMSLWHTLRTLLAPSFSALVDQVATFQGPLRDLQIHGLALLMILGVSLRMMPAFYDVPAVSRRRAWTALGLLGSSVAGEIGIFLAYRFTGSHVFAALLLLPWIGLFAGSWLIVGPWRPWRRLRPAESGPDRMGKFIRASFGWLALSLAMLIFLPLYLQITGLPFSHAYYGAIRHAITVGFVSLMIMGYASRVVPILAGLDPKKLSPLWVPFVLVNVGCLARVVLQTATDFTPLAYRLVGVSGILELTGIAIWGFGMARAIGTARRRERVDYMPAALAPECITGTDLVADVLAWFPQTEPVFIRHGFGAVLVPSLRRTLARRTSLLAACRLRRHPLEDFLSDLNAAVAAHPSLQENSGHGQD